MISYVLVKREGNSVFYWKYAKGGWTQDLDETRRYAKKHSAVHALFKLRNRPGMESESIMIQPLEEPDA